MGHVTSRCFTIIPIQRILGTAPSLLIRHLAIQQCTQDPITNGKRLPEEVIVASSCPGLPRQTLCERSVPPIYGRLPSRLFQLPGSGVWIQVMTRVCTSTTAFVSRHRMIQWFCHVNQEEITRRASKVSSVWLASFSSPLNPRIFPSSIERYCLRCSLKKGACHLRPTSLCCTC